MPRRARSYIGRAVTSFPFSVTIPLSGRASPTIM
jgi:hypothetical protein